MDSPPELEIVDWHDSSPPAMSHRRAPRCFVSPTLIGIAGTLLLHTLFIQSLPFGNRSTREIPPKARELAGALAKSKADSAESLVLITLPKMAESDQVSSQNVISSLPDMSKMKIKPPVKADPPAFLDIEMLALSEDEVSKAPTDSDNDGEKARLSGIYTGQIQARIDRVWRRPRSPVNQEIDLNAGDAGDSFQCEAQIVQDERGNVQEILLPRCNGAPAWRHSLVVAIQQASPLPAPPSAKVFSRSITVRFVGLAYVPGSSDDGYEIETQTLARE
jgi:TonB C terminal